MGENTQPDRDPSIAEEDYHGGGQGGDTPAGWAQGGRDFVGKVIDGRYRVDAVLGAGAMAVVLDAWHIHLGRRVAIKVLHPELADLAEIRARFKREARAASRVDHPAVIEVIDFGVSEEGLHYLVMEHLDGVDLHRWASARGPLDAVTAAALGESIAEALQAIHDAGFVHRDIKPENIFVLAGRSAVGSPVAPPGSSRPSAVPGAVGQPVAGGPPEVAGPAGQLDPDRPLAAPRIKVLDLGIAAVQAAQKKQDDPRLTRAGQTLGTVHFMAPEQVAARPLDGRTDVYAVGCVLYELATGTLPFDAETPTEVMMLHLKERPSPLETRHPGVPGWFGDIVLRCLEKRPEDRYPEARELALALRTARLEAARQSLDGLPTLAGRRTRTAAWLVAAGLLVGGVAAWAIAAHTAHEPGGPPGETAQTMTAEPATAPIATAPTATEAGPSPAQASPSADPEARSEADLSYPAPGDPPEPDAGTAPSVERDATGSPPADSDAPSADCDASPADSDAPPADSALKATGRPSRPATRPPLDPQPRGGPADASGTSELWRPRPPRAPEP